MRTILGVALALAAACTRPDGVVDIARSGVMIAGGQISVGAVLKSHRRIGDVAIDVEFIDETGKTVARTTDSLPSCTGRCPWGGTFVGEQFGAQWQSITHARISMRGRPATGGEQQPVSVRRTDDGTIVGTAPLSGWVYVAAIGNGDTAGASIEVRSKDGIEIPPYVIPRVKSERLVAEAYKVDVSTKEIHRGH